MMSMSYQVQPYIYTICCYLLTRQISSALRCVLMMTQPSCAPHIISSQYVVPYEFNVIVDRHRNGDLVITNIKKNTMFTIKSCDTMFHSQRLLQDDCGRPIAMLRAKNMTAHSRWNVFRGQSKADSDMIFSTATNDIIQHRYTHVNISLANKRSGSNDCDFQIKGCWSDRNCTIYMGDSSTTIIAQMHVGQSPEKFMVTIYPDVDYAFVVALIAIVDAINNPGRKEVATNAAANVATGFTTGVATGVAAEIATGVAGVAAQVACGFIFS
ncbi:putative tubby-like protein [Helianthus annuus]|nr:putative tubby-like protein [Helianthus annuus]